MITIDELKAKLGGMKTAVDDLRDALSIEASEKRLAELEHQMTMPGFYDDQARSQKVISEMGEVKNKLERFGKLSTQYEEAETLLLMIEEENDPSLAAEGEEAVNGVEKSIDELQSKVMTLEEGHDGQDTVVYREKWIDGEWAETNEVGRVNEAEMVPTVQKIYGEQVPVSGFVGPDVVDGVPVEGVAATYTGQRATGYSASATAKGASGRRLTYGTVAINPGVIPYGSLLYITSDDGKFVYGYAYAADTGTALVQGKAFIDLYYETYEESVENAVIPVTVYVLDDETAARYKEQNDAILEADTVVGR